jgi:hypothetical protein
MKSLPNEASTRSSALLILCFNRPKLAHKRVSDLKEVKCHKVVSIDGPKSPERFEQFRLIQEEFANDFEFLWMNKNEGTANHIWIRISQLLKEFDNVIVIEDDISVDSDTVDTLLELLKSRLPSHIMTIGLFGFLPGNNFISKKFNCWRESKFFSPWGWAIQKEEWEDLSLEIKEHYLRLESSKTFASLSSRGRNLWSSRFNKVINNPEFTWDYQINFWGFAQNKKHLLPAFRLADNVGFESLQATRTKAKKPNWYLGKKGTVNSSIQKFKVLKQRYNILLSSLDSSFWAESNAFLSNVAKLKRVYRKLMRY